MLTDQEIEAVFGFHPAPGNPTAMWDFQHKLAGRASTLGGASDGLNGVSADTWIGHAADTFEGTLGNLVRDVRTAAGAHDDVARAVYGYVSEQEGAKTKAQGLAQQALQAHQAHQFALNQVSQHSTASANESDAAQADRERTLRDAQRQADAAQGDFDAVVRQARALQAHMESVAGSAAQTIRAAADRAPYHEPGLLERAWDDVKGAAGAVWHVVSSPDFLHGLSTVLNIVSAVCAFIPGLQWVAIVAAVAAVGVGLLANLAAGKPIGWGEVGLGLAMAVVPGGGEIRALRGVEEASSLARVAEDGQSLGRAVDESRVGTWFLPRDGGGATIGGRWYTEHALERMAPDTPEVRALLERRALNRATAKGLQPGTPEFQQWWNLHGPNPRGVPPSVVESEIHNPGTSGVRVITNSEGHVVTVIPDR